MGVQSKSALRVREGGWIFLELHIELFSPSFAHGFINENKDTIIGYSW